MSGVILKWTLVAIAVVGGLLLIDRILLKLESRGWIFYRRNKPNFKNAGTAFIELQAMFEPKMRHVIEKRQSENEEEDADNDGDPPDPVPDPGPDPAPDPTKAARHR